MKRLSNQNGFGVVEILAVVVILGLIGCVGWFVYNSNKEADNNNKKASTSSSSQQTEQKIDLDKTYTDPVGKYSLNYPSDWSLKADTKTDDPEMESSYVTITSPSGVVLKLNSDYGGRGGSCEPEPSDKPFAIGNACPTLEFLSIEKTNINNVYYSDGVEGSNGSIEYVVKPNKIVLVTSHFADTVGNHQYSIGLTESNPNREVVKGEPVMGLVSNDHYFGVGDKNGKYSAPIYAHAAGSTKEFLQSKDAEIIKAILLSLTVKI